MQKIAKRMVLLCSLLTIGLYAQYANAQNLSDIVHGWNRCVIEVIMEDGFGPPIAARIHSYVNLAGYQAGYFADSTYTTMVGRLNGFSACAQPKAGLMYDWRVTTVAAYQTACSKLLYRVGISDSLGRTQLERLKKDIDPEIFARSKEFGIEVGKSILAFAKTDGYTRTQGLPDWEWPRCDSCWVPTPPNFAKPLSPYCGRVKPIVLKSVSQFALQPPVPFSTKEGSDFYKQAHEVYTICANLTAEQREIASFWNDNPVVTSYHGHFIFNSRQISPGGHWMNIAMQVMKEQNIRAVKCMEIYSTTAFALFDAFTACWAEKFKYNLIRPVTYINKYIEPGWEPLLQTPPFPEHASGHSTITAAAAEVLTHYFGDLPFADSTEVPFGLTVRMFRSFKHAAAEASISRMYGGIHYRRGCDAAAEHGKSIGQYIIATINPKP